MATLKPITNVSAELFTGYVNKLVSLDRQKASVVGKIRAVLKVAKDDGVDLTAMKAVMRLAKMDPDEVRREKEREIAYAQYLKLPVGTQMTLSDLETDISSMTNEEMEQKWWEDGFRCSARGGDRSESPHGSMPESQAATAWMEGYAASQREILSGIGKIDLKVHELEKDEREKVEGGAATRKAKAEKPSGEKRGRGRPPGSKNKAANGAGAVAPEPPPPPGSGA